MSEWIEGMNDGNKIDRFLHPLKSILGPSAKTLKRWDEAASKRHVTAIAGVDAHALKQNVLGFFEVEIFAYKVLFKSIRTHVLVEKPIVKNNQKNFDADKTQILNALRAGRCFASNYYHGNAKGFRFFAEFKGILCNTGDTITSKGENVILRALVPKDCRIKLVHNGNVIDEKDSMNATWDVNRGGTYRVECWLGDKGWIFSNHIRIIN
jgi:hypothetical protein